MAVSGKKPGKPAAKAFKSATSGTSKASSKANKSAKGTKSTKGGRSAKTAKSNEIAFAHPPECIECGLDDPPCWVCGEHPECEENLVAAAKLNWEAMGDVVFSDLPAGTTGIHIFAAKHGLLGN
jgi:hypothetical protein